MKNIIIRCFGVLIFITVFFYIGCGSGGGNYTNGEWKLVKAVYGSGSYKTYCYNKFGIEEENLYENGGELYHRISYEYDEYGNNISIVSSYEDIGIYNVVSNKFDDNNNLILVEEDCFNNGLVDIKTVHNYNNGNLTKTIKEIQSQDNGLITFQTDYLYDENYNIGEIVDTLMSSEKTITILSKKTYSTQYKGKVILDERTFSDSEELVPYGIDLEYDNNANILTEVTRYNSFDEFKYIKFEMLDFSTIQFEGDDVTISYGFANLLVPSPSEKRYKHFYNGNGKIISSVLYNNDECHGYYYTLTCSEESCSPDESSFTCSNDYSITHTQYDSWGNETRIETDYDGDDVIDSVTIQKWEFFPFE